MSEELRPCPFCGEQVFPPLASSFDDSYTRCGFCGAKMQRSRWQTRPIEDDLRNRIADVKDDNRSLGDSNAWLKQNYDDLERDYGTMYDKMCARIDKEKKANKVLEDAFEILRKQNQRLFWQVFSDGKPELNVCKACGGDGTVLLTDGYEGQVIATAECIYCNGTGRVNKESEE